MGSFLPGWFFLDKIFGGRKVSKNLITMNQIRFDCPGCGQTIEASEEAQFERVRCPTCQHEFFPDKTRFVSPAPAAPPTQPASPAPTLPIQQQALKLINCPACGLQISPQAKSCPGCGHPVANSIVSPIPDTRQRSEAVKSLVLGILSLLCFGILTGIPAIILGHRVSCSRAKITCSICGRRRGNRRIHSGLHQHTVKPSYGFLLDGAKGRNG